MKSQVAPYKRLLYCMRIELVSGTIIRLAQYPFDVKIGAHTYLSGYDFTGIESGTTFTPSTIDLKSFIGFAGTTEASLQSGIFDNAKAYVFATDWNDPVVDYEPITKAVFGKLTIEDNKYTAEWMTLVDLLNQSVGDSYTSSCQKVFGGQEAGGCLVDAVALRVSGTIATVTNQQLFIDPALTQDPDYFRWGKIWITSGDNAAVPPMTIKGSGGQYIALYEPFPYTVAPGDTYTIEPGCGKYLGKCVEYDNVINFGGFTYIPGDKILKTYGTN
jgi:uncharacterized phage protein (TIGR02218 family)